jgi:hydrogenase maturation factor
LVAAGGILDLAVGEYVLVHAGLVLDRISAEEAEQVMELLASLEGADLNILVGEPDGEVRV